MNAVGWNPRYLEYCRVNGETDPERMLSRDRERGAVMLEFSLWIQRKWKEWYAQLPPCDWSTGPYACRVAGHIRELHQDHKAFDLWLSKENS